MTITESKTIPVYCREDKRRGRFHTGFARPDFDWRDVVRGATLTTVEHVLRAEVIKSKDGKPRHWLITVR